MRQELELIRIQIERKTAQKEAIKAACRRANEEEAKRQEALAKTKYVWAIAKSEAGETYYYNKITKETQWTAPTPVQGLLEPACGASPDTTVVIADEITEEEQQAEVLEKPRVVKEEVIEPGSQSETQKESPEKVRVVVPKVEVERSPSPKSSRDREKDREKSREKDRERDRDRREGSKHRDSYHGHRNGSSSVSERRMREFKHELERSTRSAVRSRLQHQRDASSDKTTWLIKLIYREIFKRESAQSGFDYRFSENTDKKVILWTKK